MSEFLGELKKMFTDTANYKEVVLTDEIFNRWKVLRFLEGLDDDLAKKCALSYERLARYLLEKGESDETLEYCSFPCVRRVVQIIKDDIMPEIIVEKFESVRKEYAFLDDVEKQYGVDKEVELAAITSDAIVNQLLKSGKYKVVKA